MFPTIRPLLLRRAVCCRCVNTLPSSSSSSVTSAESQDNVEHPLEGPPQDPFSLPRDLGVTDETGQFPPGYDPHESLSSSDILALNVGSALARETGGGVVLNRPTDLSFPTAGEVSFYIRGTSFPPSPFYASSHARYLSARGSSALSGHRGWTPRQDIVRQEAGASQRELRGIHVRDGLTQREMAQYVLTLHRDAQRITIPPPTVPLWTPGKRGGLVQYNDTSVFFDDLFLGMLPFFGLIAVTLFITALFEQSRQDINLERIMATPEERRQALKRMFSNPSLLEAEARVKQEQWLEKKFEVRAVRVVVCLSSRRPFRVLRRLMSSVRTRIVFLVPVTLQELGGEAALDNRQTFQYVPVPRK